MLTLRGGEEKSEQREKVVPSRGGKNAMSGLVVCGGVKKRGDFRREKLEGQGGASTSAKRKKKKCLCRFAVRKGNAVLKGEKPEEPGFGKAGIGQKRPSANKKEILQKVFM